MDYFIIYIEIVCYNYFELYLRKYLFIIYIYVYFHNINQQQ